MRRIFIHWVFIAISPMFYFLRLLYCLREHKGFLPGTQIFLLSFLFRPDLRHFFIDHFDTLRKFSDSLSPLIRLFPLLIHIHTQPSHFHRICLEIASGQHREVSGGRLNRRIIAITVPLALLKIRTWLIAIHRVVRYLVAVELRRFVPFRIHSSLRFLENSMVLTFIEISIATRMLRLLVLLFDPGHGLRLLSLKCLRLGHWGFLRSAGLPACFLFFFYRTGVLNLIYLLLKLAFGSLAMSELFG